MYKTSNGKTIDLSKAREIAAGGEGRILEHPLIKDRVVKIYHTPRKSDFEKHLKALASLPDNFIKPIDIYYGNNNVAGFDMKYVKLSDYWLFNNLFNKGFCNANAIDSNFKMLLLMRLKTSLLELHKLGMVVGDLNQYNLFFNKKAEILFADVDSFQSSHNKHSGVLLDEIRDWTTPLINESTDAWSFDILAFWATSFVHPFKWVAPGNNELLEQRVRNGRSILINIPGIKIPPLYIAPSGHLLDQYKEIFKGRRYMLDFSGPVKPLPVIIKQQVSSSAMVIQELYNDVSEIHTCEGFITAKVAGKGWVLIETKIHGTVRTISNIVDPEIVQMFPSASGHGNIIKTNKLILASGAVTYFTDASVYYTNGSLQVLDFGRNTLYNYDFNRKSIDTGVAFSTTQLFAKSIIFRTVPIQNFGAAVCLLIPFNSTYKMINVQKGIKDAFYCRDYYAGEFKIKTKTVFKLKHAGSDNEIDLDNMPHFAVKTIFDPRKPYDLVFIPNDGVIDIYKDFQLLASMPVSNCTKDSQLYNTDSGLLMLDGKTLYLLNTK